MDRESNSATRDVARARDSRLPGEGRPDVRAANRLRGWVIAVGASALLWGAIFAAFWLVGTALQ